MLSALARHGQEVLVLLPRHARGRYAVPTGCTIRWVLARWGLDPRLANLAFFVPLLSAALNFQPDVIRVHSLNSLGLVCLMVGNLLGIPTVAHFHHSFETNQGTAWAERTLIQRFTRVVTVSEASRQQLVNLNPELRPKCTVVYNGVSQHFRPSSDDMSAWRANYQLPTDEPLFVAVGALIPRKNFQWLIRLIATWVNSGFPGRLVIAGEGPERKNLEHEVRSRGLVDYVRLWGRIDEQTNVALLQSADVFLLPSLMEGFGFAAAEALACGTPVIVSDRGALPEVVKHGETGFVLPVDRGFTPWIDSLRRLISDPNLRAEMSVKARKDVRKRFVWDRSASEVIAVYRQAVQESKAGKVSR